MYSYDINTLKPLFEKLLAENVSADGLNWLQQKGNFNTQFVLVPRKTGKGGLHISPDEAKTIARSPKAEVLKCPLATVPGVPILECLETNSALNGWWILI